MEANCNDTSAILAALSSIREGNSSAFDTLNDRFHPLMVSQVNHFCASSDESEWNEWLQEARIALYRAACTYRAEEHSVTFGVYARVCIRNAMIDQARRRGIDALPLTDRQEKAFLLGGRGKDPLDSLIESEKAALLYRRITVALSAYECRVFDGMLAGMSVSEIAEDLGKEEKSVSNAIYRLTEKLRAVLQD